jgi:hypothetical protein
MAEASFFNMRGYVLGPFWYLQGSSYWLVARHSPTALKILTSRSAFGLHGADNIANAAGSNLLFYFILFLYRR